MNELPPLLHDQRKTDLDHLRLLAIFHITFIVLLRDSVREIYTRTF